MIIEHQVEVFPREAVIPEALHTTSINLVTIEIHKQREMDLHTPRFADTCPLFGYTSAV